MNTNKNPFEDLESDLDAGGPAKPREKVTYPCVACVGTGKIKKTYGYTPMTMRTYEKTCMACKGKGSFSTPAHVREKRRAQSAAHQKQKTEKALAAFDAANPGLRAFLIAATWSDFAQGLAGKIVKYGDLTDAQMAAAKKMMAKCEERKAEREAASKTKSGDVEVSKIEELFAVAIKNGLKAPKFVTERLRVSLAPMTGKNAGALYVKDDGQYAGKIVNGRFIAGFNAKADTLALLTGLAQNPAGIARAYGRKTGNCSCCGRELTKSESIEAGIGPICASRWEL